MKIGKYTDWLIRMIGYALVLIAVSLVFKNTIYIDDSYYGIWGLITVIIIFVLKIYWTSTFFRSFCIRYNMRNEYISVKRCNRSVI